MRSPGKNLIPSFIYPDTHLRQRFLRCAHRSSKGLPQTIYHEFPFFRSYRVWQLSLTCLVWPRVNLLCCSSRLVCASLIRASRSSHSLLSFFFGTRHLVPIPVIVSWQEEHVGTWKRCRADFRQSQQTNVCLQLSAIPIIPTSSLKGLSPPID